MAVRLWPRIDSGYRRAAALSTRRHPYTSGIGTHFDRVSISPVSALPVPGSAVQLRNPQQPSTVVLLALPLSIMEHCGGLIILDI